MINASIHNFLYVVGFAVFGFFLLKLLQRTRAAKWPVVGQVIQFGAQAA